MLKFQIVQVHPEDPWYPYRKKLIGLIGTIQQMDVWPSEEPTLILSNWYWYGIFTFAKTEMLPVQKNGPDVPRDEIAVLKVKLKEAQ